MVTPKVSVVTAVYNGARYIQDAVESVLSQTYKDWEMIVVDDGSTDDTYQKVKAIGDGRIRVIRLDENSGRPAVPRNIGIKAARGEFIAFLDYDDLWLPEKLARQVERMQAESDAFLVYSRFYLQENGRDRGINPKMVRSGHVFKDLFLAHNFIACATAMIRRSNGTDPYLFDEDMGLKAVEDYDLWLSIAYREKVSLIDEPLAIYRLHSDNISSDFLPFMKRYEAVIRKHAPMAPKGILFRKYLSFYTTYYLVYAKIILRSLFNRPVPKAKG